MAALAAPVTTADVTALHHRITRFVFANFHRKLTFEEASEAAAEALAEADRYVNGGRQIADLNSWLCTASWRNAISMVRRIEGEGRMRRLRPVDISEQGEWLEDERSLEAELVELHGRRTEHDMLATAWSALKRDEQRALYLRYFDELPVEEVLGVLGCSRHHYENLTKRGLRKLRDALVAGAGDVGCRECRAAIIEARLAPLAAAAAASRDAHLSSCLACRAFEKRQRGLIAMLPLPAVSLLDRVSARLHGLLGSGADVAQPGEAGAGSAALAGAGATAGASGAATGLLGIGGAKTLAVVCGASIVTAGVCASAGPVRKPKKPARDAVARIAPPRHVSTPPPVVAVPPTSSKPAAATRPRLTATPGGGTTRSDIVTRAAAEAARKASSPFLPESAAAPPRPTARAAARRSHTITFRSAGSPATTPAVAPRAPATPAKTASFAEEFTP